MKALTLYEPWASLIATHWKCVETRGWYTSYRGPLAIHAGLATPNKIEQSRISFLLAKFGAELPTYHFGCVVAVCRLVACVPTTFAEQSAKKFKAPFIPRRGWDVERQFGNYDAGRWAWILTGVQPIAPPIPARGYRKLWLWREGVSGKGSPERESRENARPSLASANGASLASPVVSTDRALSSAARKAGGI